MSCRFPSAGALCVLFVFALACDSSSTLVVQVRTDLTPVAEFASVAVSVTGPDGVPVEQSFDVSAARDWGRGVRVAELALAPGSYRALVSVRESGGATVIERPMRVEIEPSEIRVVTMLLTRDCRGVVCPAAEGDPSALACSAGRCVTEECVEESPGDCPTPECGGAADCAVRVPCATPECTESGACFAAPQHHICDTGEVCDVVSGCVPEGNGATVEYRACAINTDCDGGRVCAFDWEGAPGRCQVPCRTVADCGLDQACLPTALSHCVGDGCGLIADTGCPAGTTCTYLERADPDGFPIIACRPWGSVPNLGACVRTADCGSGACATTDGGASQCTRYCVDSGDCGGAACGGVTEDLDRIGIGVCTAGCDPIGGGGCPSGRHCQLEFGSRVDSPGGQWVAYCATMSGTQPAGTSCSHTGDCASGVACVWGTCQQVCDMAASACPSASTCEAPLPPATIADIVLGFCS